MGPLKPFPAWLSWSDHISQPHVRLCFPLQEEKRGYTVSIYASIIRIFHFHAKCFALCKTVSLEETILFDISLVGLGTLSLYTVIIINSANSHFNFEARHLYVNTIYISILSLDVRFYCCCTVNEYNLTLWDSTVKNVCKNILYLRRNRL